MVIKTWIICLIMLIGVQGRADVLQQIRMANPSMSMTSAKRIASAVASSCRRYKVPCDVLTAVLAQESMFRVEALNRVTWDYGIGQVNYKTIEAHQWDKRRMLTDLQYSTDRAAEHLSYFYKRYRHEPLWFCRYNVGTRSFEAVESKCIAYATLVGRYFAAND